MGNILRVFLQAPAGARPEDGMRIASRYLANGAPGDVDAGGLQDVDDGVVGVDRPRSEVSASIIWRILWRTLSAEWGLGRLRTTGSPR